jgi:chromosomal replication initiation ATPase DnaA
MKGFITLREAEKQMKFHQTEARKLDEVLSRFVEFKKVTELSKARASTTRKELASRIIDVVCAHWLVTREEIFSSARPRAIADARQVAMVLCRKYSNLESPALAKLFKRVQSIIYLSTVAVSEKMETDSVFKEKMLVTESAVKNLCAKFSVTPPI